MTDAFRHLNIISAQQRNDMSTDNGNLTLVVCDFRDKKKIY